MANLIRSIGYSLGKVHSGMICHLCNQYREGHREPFESFLGALGVPMPSNPIPRREWNSVDLAILEQGKDGKETPKILIEVKVDDVEMGNSKDGFQTVRYAKKWPSCDGYLFVTLGKGEYCRKPRSDRFDWIRIRKFLDALKSIKTPDRATKDWIEEIDLEIDLQEKAFRVDKSRAAEYRGGNWNIYLFGRLVEILDQQFACQNLDVDPSCYTVGARPDTILNFGWSQSPLYMEITYSGRLSLKILLDTSKPESENFEIVKKAIEKVQRMSFAIQPTFHPRGKIGGSKKIASFDIGLVNKDGKLEFQHSIEDTSQRLLTVIGEFYKKCSTKNCEGS